MTNSARPFLLLVITVYQECSNFNRPLLLGETLLRTRQKIKYYNIMQGICVCVPRSFVNSCRVTLIITAKANGGIPYPIDHNII